MKKLLLLCISTLGFTTLLQAQTSISNGVGSPPPDGSAMLDVIATNKGMLVPRVALVATNNSLLPIPTPADGLLVYNTGAGALTTKGFYYWDATNSLWQKVQAGNGSFVTGSGTQNYVTKWNNAAGTTIGNSQIFDNGTNVGIGSATPGGKLDVFGGPITLSAGYLDINRDAYAQNGISWYAQSYPSWSTYMSPGAATSTGPHGDLTAPSGTFVTSWALRNYIENAAGYGWTFESAANTTTPAVKFEIRASDGLFHAYGNGIIDGNVGIGNIAPAHQLSVGAATVDGQAVTIRGYSNSPASWKGGGAFGYTSAAVIMGELNGVAQLGGHNATLGAWSNLAINSAGGNVGIGNTGPGEKLDVTGNIKATGVVYWGNGLTRTETRDDAGTQGGRSGFYETSVPAPAADWYTGASGWQHLLETRHSNTGNNYAMQIAGSFFDQDFWVRKTNNSATTAWSKMLTTANIGTSAIQNQYASAQTASFWVNGNAQIGSSFTNLNGRLLTSNQGGWQADGVTPQMVISANSASTNRAALIGLDLHNDNTTNNVYAPFITFSRRSNGTAYNSAFASIGAQVTGQGTDANWCAGDLIFSTENGTVNGMGERMRIDKSGRVYILQNQGNDPNFAGLDDPTSANGRAQLVLSSSYSDLVIASSEGNDNHGSTLTFASYNPGNSADYRKFVINQGNWGARFGYLDFGFADAGGRSNPHANINGTDNVITLNGINKRLGVGIMSPAQTLDVNGKARIRRGVNTMGGNANEGQLEIANTGSGDAYISFHREGAWGAHFGLGADNWFSTYGWSPGTWNALRVGAFEARGGGAFAGSAYNRDWGVGAGTTYGKVYSNLDNQVNGGLTISDDGGFYDYNDGWLQSQGSNGIMYNTSSGTYFSLYRTDRPGCCYDKQIIPQNANWGYVGTGGNYWFRMYAGAFVNGSTRESKRNITPLDESTYEVVMNDIDKIKPSFYKYNEELDDLTEGHETKYRPNYHLGVITDQSPDYIQDEAFAGIDIYAIATLGLAGVKYNRAEIKEIKETLGMTEETTRLQDFGSFVMNGNEITVPFRNSFSSKLNNSVMPVVTLTANKTDVTLAISYKDSKGFKVIASGNTNGLMVDYIAFAEVTNYSNPQKTEVSHQIMKGLVVDENIKNTIHRYWAKQKEDLEKSIVPGSKPDYVPSEPLEK